MKARNNKTLKPSNDNNVLQSNNDLESIKFNYTQWHKSL